MTNALIKFVMVLGILAASAGFSVNAQDVTPEDLKQLREIIAEREFYKAKAELETRLRKQWQQSAADWETLAAKEKDRADRVQGERVINLERALAEAAKAETVLKEQLARDQVYIDKLERRVNSLKRQRWIFSAVGFASGTAFGSRVQF